MEEAPSHENFVIGLRDDTLVVEIDSEKASELATEGVLGPTLRLTAYGWGCLWVSCFLAAPVLIVVQSWWWALLFPLGFVLPTGLRWITYRVLLKRLRDSRAFYRRSLESDVITDIQRTD